MENASKALLIAGAVLIVILLIGIGMLIYSKSTGVIDTAASTMNSQEIQSFNSQFTPYEGTQKGSSVKSLISTITANNATYQNETDKKVTITIGVGDLQEGIGENKVESAEQMSGVSAKISTSHSYKVTFTEYKNGLISNIRIEP